MLAPIIFSSTKRASKREDLQVYVLEYIHTRMNSYGSIYSMILYSNSILNYLSLLRLTQRSVITLSLTKSILLSPNNDLSSFSRGYQNGDSGILVSADGCSLFKVFK